MNSSTSQQPDRANSVAKLLDRARSINIRPDPEDVQAAAPQSNTASAPVQREVPAAKLDAEPVSSPQEGRPASDSKPRARRKADSGRTVNRSFDIVTGPSTRALTVRIPDEIHARLVLVATSNRLGRTGEASTLNELIAEGIEHVLQRYDAA